MSSVQSAPSTPAKLHKAKPSLNSTLSFPSSEPDKATKGFKNFMQRARVKSVEQFKVFAHKVTHPHESRHEKDQGAPRTPSRKLRLSLATPPRRKSSTSQKGASHIDLKSDGPGLDAVVHNILPLFSTVTPSSVRSRSSTTGSDATYNCSCHCGSCHTDQLPPPPMQKQEEEPRPLPVDESREVAVFSHLDQSISEVRRDEERALKANEVDGPDPFVVDDSDAEQTSPASSDALPVPGESVQVMTPVLEVPERSPIEAAEPAPVSVPVVDKQVPPVPPPAAVPSDTDEDEEEEAPEINAPLIVAPTNFLPIPNTDPLSTLLAKYVHPPELRPPRDVTGEWHRTEFHTLVMSNSWRALARMARDRIVNASPEDLPLVLGLWYLRLSSLARLRLFNQTAAECTNLFNILHAISPPSAKEWVFERLLPFELEVMQIRLRYWSGDFFGHLDALTELLAKCRNKARAAPPHDELMVEMWKERGSRVILMMASQLLELRDYMAAANLLEPLCAGESSTATLRSAIARIYLQAGYLDMAEKHFAIVAEDPRAEPTQKEFNAALLAAARGDWESARGILTQVVQRDAENYVAVNNLAVVLLGQGKIKEGIGRLEQALQSSPSSVVVAEPFLFNLSTLYELCSATATEKKRSLLIEVAKWSGDGLKATCLKMPTN